jgi:hypothetical protein
MGIYSNGGRLAGVILRQRTGHMNRTNPFAGRRSRRVTGCCIALLAAAVLFYAGCSQETKIELDPIVISTVEPANAASGDTIVITGSGFNPTPSSNRIIVSPCQTEDDECMRIGVPYAGSTTELRGIVPDGSFTGNMRIENSNILPRGLPMAIEPPHFPSNWLPFGVSLNEGDVAKVFFGGTSYDYSIETEGADDYLLILFNSVALFDDQFLHNYHVSLDVATGLQGEASAARQDDALGEDGTEPVPVLSRYTGFEIKVWKEIEEYLRDIEAGGDRIETGGVQPVIFGPGEAPQTADFDVYTDIEGSVLDPASFTVVTGHLRFEGTHTLLYVDERTPLSILSDVEAEEIGQAFDASIYATDRNAFGNESDINGDSKVAILMTEEVNNLPEDPGSIILGFFMPNDLLPIYLNPGVTNGMEIFYTMVPDPAIGGVDWKTRSIQSIKSTLAHEFQHMIMFNYRVLIYGSGYLANYMEELWINEALSHIAEDLNGYDADNIARVNLFLHNTGSTKLTFLSDDNLSNRGAVYLFLRYLGDRFSDTIFRTLVQSRHTGTENVETATGTGFLELFADWSAALYLSGRGITSDPRFNYSSIDLQGDFDPLYLIQNNMSIPELDGTMKPMGSDYILFNASSQVSYDVSIMALSGGSMHAVIIRLD